MSVASTTRRRRRPPFFHPVPLRARRDGWSVERQCAFLGHLYLTGCVTTAARAVGMSRESAHRLRLRRGAAGFRPCVGLRAHAARPHCAPENRLAKSHR
ncbi:LysR family transcriptional regulator [Erythrobacter sp. GH3-10]|uniref:LysR family transcriptional regulator n=2 Tax=Aurantiacibacter rhizosphaerae TaxID=2691582 RepID=A0A844XH66_9SPHN|nr:LysR family transcriptional regulator [Aurantiacibacter rhizosphaerae]